MKRVSRRVAARVDANQAIIAEALRKAGCSVALLHRLGAGVPDILVGTLWDGKPFETPTVWGRMPINLLMEIKMPGEKLTPDEHEFHSSWRGQIAIVHSIAEALACVGIQHQEIAAIERHYAQTRGL